MHPATPVLVLALAVGLLGAPAAAAGTSGNTDSQHATAESLPAPQVRISVRPARIARGQTAAVSLRGVPGERLGLWAYTSPSQTYRLVRTGTAGATGLVTWSVRPGADTRLYGTAAGGARRSASVVLQVRRPTAYPPAVTSLQQGQRVAAVYLAVSGRTDDPALAAAVSRARRAGYSAGAGDLNCDQGATAGLGLDPAQAYLGVAVYFSSSARARQFADRYPFPVVGVVSPVTIFCAD